MAAAFWQAVLVAQLAIAAAIAWPIAAAFAGSFGAHLALWLIVFLLLQPLLVLTGFAASGLAARDTRRPLRAGTIARESVTLLGAALSMSTHVSRATHRSGRPIPHAAMPGRRETPPVLLVHGILCNAAIWRPLQRRLSAAGFNRVEVIELRPLFADIEAHAENLVQALRAMQGRCEGERIVIVAHSMGGLVARAALRAAGPALIARIITLGTPHHGTTVACRLPFAPTRQMCPSSPWLQRLNAEQENRPSVPVTCLCSSEDTLIAPPRSAELAGARVIRVDGLGHLGLAYSASAQERVLGELRRG